ncbi:hypothetical protein KC19_11G141800 [Ceratodon purpureus]|uniref:Uncharacterized protein n=1 Tax=Ceratodon purpureus TaxID=3225 RepID=A0A8T0GEZ0_CERPU|nr:hypothetical protein KC19_11G141800 [Ceratodon purpureus]
MVSDQAEVNPTPRTPRSPTSKHNQNSFPLPDFNQQQNFLEAPLRYETLGNGLRDARSSRTRHRSTAITDSASTQGLKQRLYSQMPDRQNSKTQSFLPSRREAPTVERRRCPLVAQMDSSSLIMRFHSVQWTTTLRDDEPQTSSVYSLT